MVSMRSLREIFDSYRIKLLLAIILINLFMVPILVVNRIWLFHKDIYTGEAQAIASLSAFVLNSIEDDLAKNDTVHLQRAMQIAMRHTGIRAVMVTDNRGVVLFSSDPGLVGGTVPVEKSGAMNEENRMRYAEVQPVFVRGGRVGYMRLVFSLAQVRREVREAVYWSFGLNGAWMLGVLIAAYIVSGRLYNPLAEMKDVSQRIARGDFEARSTIRSHDAVGQLAAALNDMAAQLYNLTAGMQDRIGEATAGLRIANETLNQKMREIEETNRKLLELDALKSEFVSMVSHDLKTPLTSIIGFARTLMSLELPPEQRVRYLRIIEGEGKRLSRLISEYLDISKIEAGRFVLNCGEVSLPALIDEIVQITAPLHPERLRISIGDSVGTITADKERLRRAIMNVIDNALKYSPVEEKILIGADRVGEEIVIAVEDRGVGVPPDEREKIFAKFYRSGRLAPNRYPGSGLGLTIARAVVLAHGGSIAVEEAVPKGSRFIIRLPVSVVSPPREV
jgi:signal transduction histidine kinase